MIELRAGQILYTRLSKDRSRSGKDGYQTLCCTRAIISDTELPEIEARFLYFPTETSPPKHVFFGTRGGKLVLARITRLGETDDHGRLISIAHGVVFVAADLIRAGLLPLAVFEVFPFLTDLRRALEVDQGRSGDAPPVTIAVPDPVPPSEAGRWSLEELRKLAFYALRAQRLAEKNTALAMTGSPESILAVMGVAQAMLPPARYGECPMDTYFVDAHRNPCNLHGNYCWAVGLPEPPRFGNFIMVDAEKCRINDNPSWKPADAYECWLAAKLAAGRLDEIVRDKGGVDHVSRALAGESLGEAVPPRVIEEVCRAGPELVRSGLRDRMARLIGGVLADRLVDSVMAGMTPAEMLERLGGGFEAAALLQHLFEHYAANRFRRPAAEELKALGSVLEAHPRRKLQLLWAAWGGEDAAIQRAGRAFDDAGYEQACVLFLDYGLPEVLGLVQPGRGTAFLRGYLASDRAHAIPLPGLVDRLLQAGEDAALDLLEPRLARLPLEDLKELRRLCKRMKSKRSLFKETLESAYREALKERGLFAQLRHKFGM
ncbi:MAG TPA: hypothetical protein PKY77_03410 [Phycisphaerae bacterium]|nr:hypothetical protein [Phycisphaerae bacterium]HRY67353.1 hypothetical protein [Phycisphaerae bacterium]HSA29422.1 hypothetical protein [Phycisphaerae bacterium]